jgi:hypothetical protein
MARVLPICDLAQYPPVRQSYAQVNAPSRQHLPAAARKIDFEAQLIKEKDRSEAR